MKSSKVISKRRAFGRIPEVVTIPNPLFKSLEGKYFVGQTQILTFGRGTNAWGGLINPKNSGVNLFVNVYTVTNFSGKSFPAKVFLNSLPPGHPLTSRLVSPTNTSRNSIPKVKIQFVRSTMGIPRGGTNVFLRETSPKATLVSEEDGKFIIPPGGSFVIFLAGPRSGIVKSKIAFGWWEEKRKSAFK
ncbi:hypothetical protein H1230_01910 [Paenibacillus sp. 19GGS1-52]|uniref:DUF6143 family protein n=1 Tax=Paenibacillus sp. 19GGS1-52 TaxID=2758563 RepID=UPI001EFB2DC7|nr:DUF6143 family protein [Paenibacillus sp. 19GGS1-52]ULO07660.1 hypothetical protein H1230_01910 [Paenibacillus sp. 19GGS1-52]